MTKKLRGVDWDLMRKIEARSVTYHLKKTLPAEWSSSVDIVAKPDSDLPKWMQSGDVLERLDAFKKLHGGAIDWALTDSQVIEKARDLARWFDELLELRGGANQVHWQLDLLVHVCDVVGIEYPRAITAQGAINRALSDVWWRRAIRKKVARMVEGGAIKLGLVNRQDGGYCSDAAVLRRDAQLKRNQAMLSATLLRNEAGQVFRLSELAEKSTANPVIRGAELMTRIRGCEEFAQKSKHVGYFLTGTAPSKYHAVRLVGKGPRATVEMNPAYDGVSTPRDAQSWLCDQWAKTRAKWARDGVKVYGFRVAEPHHDGCPHWHLLLWFENDKKALQALAAFGEKWLSDGGAVTSRETKDKNILKFEAVEGAAHEKGALKNRCNFKRMESGKAAGYVAKYIAKNVGNVELGMDFDTVDGEVREVETKKAKGWQRVDAWAAHWGIRQFQAIGQPPVTVWRELRRVTRDQIEAARVAGEAVAAKVWAAVHKVGDIGADWCRYMQHQGGAALRRGEWLIQPFMRVTDEHVNGYGETIEKRVIVGCETDTGRVLVSRRQGWAHVGREVGIQSSDQRKAMGAPWTRFTNCTARLGGQLRAALLGLNSGIGGRYGGALG